jgi:hypothetical protein
MQGNSSGDVRAPGGNNGHKTGIAADAQRIEDLVHRLKFNRRVLVQPLKQFCSPAGIGSDRFSSKQLFVPIGDRAAFHQIHQCVAEKRRVDAQMLLAGQCTTDCFKQRSHGEGNAALIFNQRFDVGGDQVVDRFAGHRSKYTGGSSDCTSMSKAEI